MLGKGSYLSPLYAYNMNFITIFAYNIKRMDETVELIQKYRKGDRCAFELLYLKHKDIVFRNAIFMVGDRQEAEDVLQEVTCPHKVYQLLS